MSSHSSAFLGAAAAGRAGNSSRTTIRTRRNQPRGYSGGGTTTYRCRKHDYIYYPASWVIDGRTYESGYYDEEGNHYDSVVIRDQETICKCPYCDTLNKIKWTGGAMPKCENCGGTLDVVETDDLEPETRSTGYTSTYYDNAAPRKRSRALIPILITVLAAAFIGIVFIFIGRRNSYSDYGYEDDYAYEDEYEDYGGEEIYVAEIDRYCTMDADGNYYDAETGTYFWFNTELEPAQWQYWVEGISDEYGDYGWLEYDDAKETWYIETEDGWQVLDGSETEGLWHFDDAYTNNVY